MAIMRLLAIFLILLSNYHCCYAFTTNIFGSTIQKVDNSKLVLSHHENEYKFDHHVADRLFEAFGNKLNPILKQVIQDHSLPKLSISHHMIRMRDGIHLSTIVLVPTNTIEQGKKIPAMLSRSPYGPTSDSIALIFSLLNGHAAIIQDQRGTFLSEGFFSMWQKDAEDGYDTMEWIVSQPWSNREVFGSGISADGCGALTLLLSKPQYLKGQLIVWASADGHKTSYPGGAFREGLITGWMSVMGLLTKGYSLTHTLPDILAHEELGPWWQNIETAKHFGNVEWPTIHLSAWWDIFQGHQLEAYDGFRKEGHHSFRDSHTLIVSPLGHCMLGDMDPMLMSHDARAIINGFGYASEVFDSVSKGLGPISRDGKFGKKLKRINIFVQGPLHEKKKNHYIRDNTKSYGNYWSSFDSWPKYESKKLYIAPGGRLVQNPERFNTQTTTTTMEEEFTYTPLNPTITHGGNNLILIFLGMGCGSMDQRSVESRSDVLVFTTETLTEPMAITGPVSARLSVSSNRNDTDFFVSLTDVYPDGRSMQVRFGLQRMRWRESTTFESKLSKPMIPGVVYTVNIDMWRTSHIFAPGHKIRITISSSNNPYYSRNDDDYHKEKAYVPDTILPAQNKVHFHPETPSYIDLPLVKMSDLPENKAF